MLQKKKKKKAEQM